MTEILKDAARVLGNWAPKEQGQDYARLVILDYLEQNPDAHQRTSLNGCHLTVSAVLVDQDCRALLTFHPKFEIWMQLGGHLEDRDASLAQALLREAREESGLQDLVMDPEPLTVDLFTGVHCPKGSISTHLDICFLLKTQTPELIVCSEESISLAWHLLSSPPHPHDDAVTRMLRVASGRLASE